MGGVIRIVEPFRQSLVASIFSPDTLQLILVLDALVFLYRLAAIVDGYRVARRRSLTPTTRGRRPRPTLQPLSVAGLLAVVLGLGLGHAALARDDRIAYDTLTAITSTDGAPGVANPVRGDGADRCIGGSRGNVLACIVGARRFGHRGTLAGT
jgi:hypothetical protein